MKFKKTLFTVAAGSLLACSSTPDQPVSVASAGCSQLPDVRGAVTELYEPGSIYAAKPVRKKIFKARAIQPERTVGADVYVHARKGMTPEYLQRVLSCHVVAGTALHPNDPLHPQAGRVADLSVRSAGSNLAVRILGDNPATGKEIYQRAAALATGSGSVSVEQVAAGSSPPVAL